MKCLRATIQIKATEHYFPVVLFIMLFKVVLIIIKKTIHTPSSSTPFKVGVFVVGTAARHWYCFERIGKESFTFPFFKI